MDCCGRTDEDVDICRQRAMVRIDDDGMIEFAVEIRFGAEVNACRRPDDIESIRALEGGTGIDLVESCDGISWANLKEIRCLCLRTIRADGNIIFANWVSGAFRTRILKDVAIVDNP